MYATNFVGVPNVYGSSGDGSAGTSAKTGWPDGLAVSTVTNNLYWVERTVTCRVRKISLVTGIVSSVAGTGTCGSNGDSGPALFAQLNQPRKLLLDSSENIYISCQTGTFVIRKLTASTGILTTVVGQYGLNTWNYVYNNVPGTSITLIGPTGMVFDPYGNILIADSNGHTVRKFIPSTGYVSIAAGSLYSLLRC